MENPVVLANLCDHPFREVYWNIPPAGHYWFYLPAAIAVIIFFYGVVRRVKIWRMGKAAKRTDGIAKRGWGMLWDSFTQKLVLREFIPGLIHAMIFFGFLVLFVGTVVVTAEADLGITTIGCESIFGKGSSYLWFTVILNGFGLLAILGILFALIRRYVFRSKYLDNKSEDWFVLLLMLLILVTGYLIQAFRLAVVQPEWAPYSFLSYALAKMFVGSNPDSLRIAHHILWWIHLFLAMSWLAVIPFTKLWHIFAGMTNLFFRSSKHRGRIEKMNLEDEQAQSYGLSRLEDFTWKQLLDTDACIRCGRCQENCPAKLTNKPLNPKEVIQNIKSHMEEVYRLKKQGKKDNEDGTPGDGRKDLRGAVVPPDVVWSCTTCRACEANCPMGIEHLDSIIGIRQCSTLMDCAFPPEVTNVFKGMENNSNPWSIGSNKRMDWAEGLGVQSLSENPEHEILLWVGCAGSFDDRAIKVTKALVKVLQVASVKFAVLGIEEGCCGETARRMGNEYLAQTLIQTNVEMLNNYKVKKILATCPHCFNTLKNEYPDFGGNFEVVHHTEFILELLRSGRLPLTSTGNGASDVVIHDSCYLGRYNGIYKPPREILKSMPGISLREASRKKRKGFCCGAGGGRMWMEEKLGSRINSERTAQLLATGAKTFAVGCPYCLTMISDGIKEKDLVDSHKVFDVVEIVASHLKGSPI